MAKLKASYGFLSDRHARRLVRLYGTKAAVILGEAASVEALGRRFGGDLYEREVAWLMEKEWARTSEDVLWRRTKQGLHFSREEAAALNDYMMTKAA